MLRNDFSPPSPIFQSCYPPNMIKKKRIIRKTPDYPLHIFAIGATHKRDATLWNSGIFHLFHDSLESLGIVHGEVGEHLTVDLDTGLVDQAHELGIGEILETSSCIDTLDPESAEVALFLLTVTISVSQTLLPGVLGYCPYIAAASIVTAGEFEDFLSLCS